MAAMGSIVSAAAAAAIGHTPTSASFTFTSF